MARSVEVSTVRDLSSSLPDELLAEIFLHLHSCRLGESERSDLAYHPTPPWVPASHVCARWRNVAIHCRKLWSFIVDADPHWTKISIQRSDPLPISLRAEIYPTTPHESIVALIDLIKPARLASVQIWFSASASTDPDDEPYTWWLIKLTTSPTPWLKHFEIAVSYEQVEGPSRDTTNIQLCLPWDYLGKGEESPLRSLKLSQCVLTTLFVLHGSSKLVSLNLDHCFYAEDEDGDVLGYDFLLDALSASPNLENLSLSWSTSPGGPALGSSFVTHSIKLPRLRAFYLDDDLGRAFDLLSYISIPSSANTHIGLEWEAEEADAASYIAKVQDFDVDGLLLDSQPSPYRDFYITQHDLTQHERSSSRIGFDVSLRGGLLQSDEQTLTFSFNLPSPESMDSLSMAVLASILKSLAPQLSLMNTLIMGVNPVHFDWVREVSAWGNI
ncbi:hypothetical protein PENSPDRAFT_359385 [Peniophora sp. CONT]|nr:hypothetical protein PENSPDRAFT_359385 [Peniophora sp. CONT]